MSGTGGLSGEAGSSITVTLPAGTGTTGWQSGTVRNVSTAADVGSCPQPTSGVTRCTFFSSGIVNPDDQLRITLRGLTNGPAGAKTLSVVTSTDLTPVTSSGFTVVAGGSVTTPTVSIAAPSPATGAQTRYVVGFRVSATGGLSGEAGSSDHRRSPGGTGTTGWQSGTLRDVTRAVDIGSCPQPTAGRTRCTFFSSGFANPGDELQIILRGLTNAGVGAQTVAVTTSSDLPQITVEPVHGHRRGHAHGLAASRHASRSPRATIVRMRVSAPAACRARRAARSGSRSRPAPRSPATSPGRSRTSPARPSVGFCGTPVGLAVTCGFFSAGFVNPGDVLEISFPVLTSAPGTINASTSSDTATVPVEPGGGGGGGEPTPEPTPTRRPRCRRRSPPRRPRRRRPPRPPPRPRRASCAAPCGSSSRARTPTRSSIPARASRSAPPSTPSRAPCGISDAQRVGRLLRRHLQAHPGQGRDRTDAGRAATGCKATGKASAAAKKAKSRKLWGKGKGAFRTAGKYSAATVRGTTWLVQDTCTSTLTRVTEGVVTVRDNVKKKNVVVRAGKRYTAKPKR